VLLASVPAYPHAVAGAAEAAVARAVAALQVVKARLTEHLSAPTGAVVCLDVVRCVLRAQLPKRVAVDARLVLQPPPLAPDLVCGNQRSLQRLRRFDLLRLHLHEKDACCLRSLRARVSSERVAGGASRRCAPSRCGDGRVGRGPPCTRKAAGGRVSGAGCRALRSARTRLMPPTQTRRSAELFRKACSASSVAPGGAPAGFLATCFVRTMMCAAASPETGCGARLRQGAVHGECLARCEQGRRTAGRKV